MLADSGVYGGFGCSCPFWFGSVGYRWLSLLLWPSGVLFWVLWARFLAGSLWVVGSVGYGVLVWWCFYGWFGLGWWVC